MPLFDRDTLIDRPTLIDRGELEDKQERQDEEAHEIETIGEGGGPVVHGVEFEKGMYEIVAGANLAGVLATGEEDGRMFRAVFSNAANQLHLLKQQGEEITDLVRFAVEKDVADYGLTESDFKQLRGEVEGEDSGEEEEEVEEEPHEGDDDELESSIEEVEEELDTVKDGSEQTEESGEA